MCGIIGMAGHILQKHEQCFTNMLIVDSIRGMDSTGVCSVDTNSNIIICKHAMLPQDLIQLPKYKEILSKVNRVLIGHNRWATRGKINRIN